jgi:hypothetical protein
VQDTQSPATTSPLGPLYKRAVGPATQQFVKGAVARLEK